MRKILLKIGKGKTIGDIAKELDMEEPTIRAIVDSMVHTGYIVEIRREIGCSMCPMKCLPPFSEARMYVVTEKGMEYLMGKHK